MADTVVIGTSSVLTDEDKRKRGIVRQLIRSENKRLADYAKQVVTISFSAVGVVLGLKDKWLGKDAPSRQTAPLAIAIALFLGAGLLATLAAGIYRHRVSVSDFDDVDAELHRVAKHRYWLIIAAFVFLTIATIIVATIVISI
jgi:hypothetical protein